ncbi:glycosyltransferase family 4 protein [Hymenobacter crusticola]|uniref:Glycosyltransferase n=1 Tax=Hymenobacter crusticola TaxID=1770526 RepID=A0A243WKF5_9BACT|nr:glycosyltransferase family 4 protein [Hymenobacter crusticola]OUJ76079.1 glycosyltransferase [Hymenobacter crusticola]
MKILTSAYACDPTRGGEEGFGFSWAWQTAQQGHTVWCLTRPVGRPNIEAYLADQVHDSAASRLKFEYIAVPRWVDFLARWQFGIYLHYLVWQYLAWRTAKRLDERAPFDLVHHATYGSLQMGSWLWRLGKPMIFGPVGGGQQAPKAFRDYLPNWYKTEIPRTLMSRLLVTFDSNVRKNLQHASVVLATNQETAALARNLGAQRVELFLDSGLPESFIPAQFPERQPAPELRLLWLGRLISRKALPVVLAALAQVAPRVRFRLTIVGDGPMMSLLPGLIQQYGLEGRVTCLGTLPWSEVRHAYLTHDAFMFTSLRDSFAAQFLEAMATGLPIITLNHQGARDFIPAAAGLKVPVTTPEETIAALARAVEHFYDHPAARENMGRAGYAFAITQTWPKRVSRLLQFADEIVPAQATVLTPRSQSTSYSVLR